jgi:GNAT superfamily N-acetyltransferase
MTINTLPAITIRSLEPGDREQWEQLYRQYAEFYRATMNDAILDRTWSWLMDLGHPEEGIVAELAAGELVGLAHYRPFPEPLLGQDAGFLDDLFVSTAHRGQGVGRGLIASVASIARDRRWPLVRWVTAHDNAPARRLYAGLSQMTAWVTYDLNPASHETVAQ